MSPMAAVNSVGERVVVDGTDRSRDGARVIMPAAPSQAPAADPPSNAQGRQPVNGRHAGAGARQRNEAMTVSEPFILYEF